uniref:Uncharacterized protein n=1 Tax=Anguilla anguilla TaxID=7936 RepID=A0A0E9PPK9_ANGAN
MYSLFSVKRLNTETFSLFSFSHSKRQHVHESQIIILFLYGLVQPELSDP